MQAIWVRKYAAKHVRRVYTIVQWLLQHPPMLFLVWTMVIAGFYFGLGTFSYVRIIDNTDSTLSARILLAHLLNNGNLGWWNPYLASGDDLLSSSHLQWSVLLFVLLPDWLAYGLLMFIQRFIAGYFMFRLLRDSVEVDTAPAVVAGLFFSSITNPSSPELGFAGFTTYDELALPGLPLIMWLLWFSDRHKAWWSYLIAIGTGILWSLTSIYVFTVFLLPFIGLFFLVVVPIRRLDFWAKCIAFVIAWAVCTMPHLFVAITFASMSHRADRGGGTLTLRSMLSSSVIGLLKSQPYVIPFCTGVIGLIAGRRHTLKLGLILTISALIVLFFAWYPLFYHILLKHVSIVVSAGVRDRVYVAIPFWVTVAAGVGIQAIAQDQKMRVTSASTSRVSLRHALILGMVFMVLVTQMYTQCKLFLGIRHGLSYHCVYEHPVMKQLAHYSQGNEPYRVATIFSGALQPHTPAWHPAYAWAYGYETADGYLNLYPDRYKAFWSKVIAPLKKLDNPNSYYFSNWGNRIYLFAPGSSYSILPPPPDNTIAPLRYYDPELLSLANVRYIITPFRLVDTDWVEVIPAYTGTSEDKPYLPIAIYENQQVLPRFFVAHHLHYSANEEDLLQTLSQASLHDLKTTAYARQKDVPHNTTIDALETQMTDADMDIPQSHVTVGMYSADRIVLNVQTNAAGILVATNKYNPYWKAYIDGVETAIFPVDHAFQGIYCPEAQHEIVLHYEPPWMP